MANGLDVVAVRVEHALAVLTGVVLGPLGRRAVGAVAGGERDAVELVDGDVVRYAEREVDVLRRVLARDEPHGGHAGRGPVADRATPATEPCALVVLAVTTADDNLTIHDPGTSDSEKSAAA
jgi:hypothetical protein